MTRRPSAFRRRGCAAPTGGATGASVGAVYCAVYSPTASTAGALPLLPACALLAVLAVCRAAAAAGMAARPAPASMRHPARSRAWAGSPTGSDPRGALWGAAWAHVSAAAPLRRPLDTQYTAAAVDRAAPVRLPLRHTCRTLHGPAHAAPHARQARSAAPCARPMPYALCPMPCALCPMPYALCPMPYALCPMPCALRPSKTQV
jgi:hypothetical protein